MHLGVGRMVQPIQPPGMTGTGLDPVAPAVHSIYMVESNLDASRQPKLVTLVSLEHLHGYQPQHYLGAVLASGPTVAEAIAALEKRALHLARENHAHRAADSNVYVVLGLRFASSITASGQPEWVAYGTLARGTIQHEQAHQPPN